MASPSSLFLIVIAITLLFYPAQSQTCTSQPFSSNFTTCQDLPTLRATIHYTYTPTARPNPTLSIAFSAPPAQSGGWVAWALNPTGTGMLGAQSLIAFRDTNGSMVVRTYNISSYSSIAESRIAYNVLSSRVVFSNSNNMTTIFATLALPVGGSQLNQVWQVGSDVNNGVPVRHAFDPPNLNSMSRLQLDGTVNAPAPSPAGSGGRNGTTAAAPAPAVRPNGNGSGVSAIIARGFGLYGSLVLIGAMILGFY